MQELELWKKRWGDQHLKTLCQSLSMAGLNFQCIFMILELSNGFRYQKTRHLKILVSKNHPVTTCQKKCQKHLSGGGK